MICARLTLQVAAGARVVEVVRAVAEASVFVAAVAAVVPLQLAVRQ